MNVYQREYNIRLWSGLKSIGESAMFFEKYTFIILLHVENLNRSENKHIMYAYELLHQNKEWKLNGSNGSFILIHTIISMFTAWCCVVVFFLFSCIMCLKWHIHVGPAGRVLNLCLSLLILHFEMYIHVTINKLLTYWRKIECIHMQQIWWLSLMCHA